MGDWTWGRVDIVGDLEAAAVDDDGEPTTIGKIVRAIVEEYIGAGDVDDDAWALYIVRGETRCGSAGEIATELDGVLAAQPGAFAYYVSEDPYGEWLGDVLIRVPSIPERFECQCDADGRPVVGWQEVSQALNAHPDAPPVETLRRLLGVDWHEAFGELQPARCSGHKTADRYGNTWDCREVLNRDGTCPTPHVEASA